MYTKSIVSRRQHLGQPPFGPKANVSLKTGRLCSLYRCPRQQQKPSSCKHSKVSICRAYEDEPAELHGELLEGEAELEEEQWQGRESSSEEDEASEEDEPAEEVGESSERVEKEPPEMPDTTAYRSLVLGEAHVVLEQAGMAFHNILASRDLSDLDQMVTEDVTLHQDGLLLKEDITGIQAVREYLESYLGNHTFEHVSPAHAVDLSSGSYFSVSLDKDVTPNPERPGYDALSEELRAPRSTLGLWRLLMDGELFVTDIWFMRQLAVDEVAEKMAEPPVATLEEIGFEAMQLAGPKFSPSVEYQARIQAATEAVSAVWATQNPEHVQGVLSPDFIHYQPAWGEISVGEEPFAGAVAALGEEWEMTGHGQGIAITPDSNKAFLHWSSEGTWKESGEEGDLEGMSLLLFDMEGNLSRMLTYRNPTPSEAARILRP